MAKKITKKENKVENKLQDKQTQTNKIKVIEEKDKEIITNKGVDMEENAQTIDLKIAEKEDKVIETETTGKPVENTQTSQSEIGEQQLVDALKIPMQKADNENEENPVKEALFNSPENEPKFESEEEEEETEDLNDRYFGGESDGENEDFGDGVFFEDETLMAEMGVEVIDLFMTSVAQGIAGDFSDNKDFSVSDYKKNKIKKPLELLLRKRGVKASPEVMLIIVLLVVYTPMMVLAVNKRKEKQKKKNKKRDVANDIPQHITEVDYQAVNQSVKSAEPMVIPIEKKKGRPVGSKDTSKRKTDKYKGNKNAKN